MSENWWYPAAPAAALLGSVLTWAAGAVWGDNIGLGACSYRLPYSPYGPAFSIWSLIYLWSDVGCFVQFLPGDEYTGLPEVNLCAALCWSLCALWITLFNPLYRAGIVASGVVITCAAAAGTTAAALDQEAWNTLKWEAILTTAIPNSLLGGWLLAASSLGLGSAYLAATGQEPQCEYIPRAERRQRNRIGDPYAESVRAPSLVPVVLALAVAILGGALPNPVLPLPLSWAIWWMGPRGKAGQPSQYPAQYWSAMVALWAGSGVAVWRIAENS